MNFNANLFLGASLPAVVLAGAGLWAAAPAQAQGIEEIIVTAQKREENLQDVPVSITAFTSAALEARGATAITSLLQAPPPGVVMQPFAGSPSMLIVDIRGVTNGDPGQGTADMGTAVYIDDVYLGRAQGMGAELADPERIEVLRGPQGTLFGRNAEGGAIRIVTKKPTGELGGNARIQYGNYNQQRYEAHLNLPAIAGFAVKLDYLKTKNDGWTKNPRDSRLASQYDFGMTDAEGWRASVRWQPVDDVTIDYAYDHSDMKDVRDWNVLVRPPMAFKADGGLLDPLTTLQGARQQNESIHKRTRTAWTALSATPFRTKSSGHMVQIGWDLSDSLTLRSITGFRKTSEKGSGQLGGAFSLTKFPAAMPMGMLAPAFGNDLGIDLSTPLWGISGVAAYNELDQKQESQEFQLVGSFPQIEFVVGGYYFHEKVTDLRQTHLSIVYTDPDFTEAVGVNPFTVGSAGAGLNVQEAESTSYAGFAQATWSPDFADNRLHLTGGIRFTSDKKTFLRTMANGAPDNLVGEPFREKRWDPAVTLAFDFTDTVNGYVRYAQAYRAGGVSVRSPNFKPFGAEVNKSFEAGIKSELLDRQLRFNVAVFENRIHNRQITAQLDPTGNPAITDTLNAPGITRIRGGEIELLAAPTHGLQLSATYAYLTGKRPPSYLVVDPNAELRIQSLPKHAVTAAVDYLLPIADFADLAFHFDYAMASKTSGTGRVAHGAFAWDIERNVANGRISLQNMAFGPANLKLALYGKNLFNTINPVFTAPGGNAVLSPPRTYGVELGLAF